MASQEQEPSNYFSSCFLQRSNTEEQIEEEKASYARYEDLISSLPQNGIVRPYQGFWFMDSILLGILAFRDSFTPRAGDVILATFPKSGTTWIKALAFATLYRKDHSFAHHPLHRRHPQDCAPSMESLFSMHQQLPNLDVLPTPRLLATHTPYSLLPESITTSDNNDCRIVYLCRDPRDTLVSFWHFSTAMSLAAGGTSTTTPFDVFFEWFCDGSSPYGPVWDHVLEYWHASLKRPQKVLFLKYEDLKQDTATNVRKLAEFMGCPFSPEEVIEGVVEEIVKLCSFENLRSLEVNVMGARGDKDLGIIMTNSSFFRKGKVGDWVEHLTPEMARRIDRINQEKLQGSGLSFADSAAMMLNATSSTGGRGVDG